MTSRTRYPVFIALALLLMSVAGFSSSAFARHRFRDRCCFPINPCPSCPAPVACPSPCPVISCPAPAPVISCPAPRPVISCPAPCPVVSCPAPAPVVFRRVVTVTTCCPTPKVEVVTPVKVVEEKPVEAPPPPPEPVINVPAPEPPPAPEPRPRKLKL